jgi:hypothetical protein
LLEHCLVRSYQNHFRPLEVMHICEFSCKIFPLEATCPTPHYGRPS